MKKIINFLSKNKNNINIETYKTLVLTFEKFKTMSDLERTIPKEIEKDVKIQIDTPSLKDVKLGSIQELSNLMEITGSSFSELKDLKLTVIVEKAKVVDSKEAYFFKDEKSLEKELLYAKDSLASGEGNEKELKDFLYGKKSYLTLASLQV